MLICMQHVGHLWIGAVSKEIIWRIVGNMAIPAHGYGCTATDHFIL